MSHTTAVKAVEMKNVEIMLAVAKKMGIKSHGHVTDFKMYDYTKVTGYKFELEGWSQPIVVDNVTGGIAFDNYNGSWGDIARLDEFVQGYATEVTKQQALLAGYAVQEEFLKNGDCVLTMESLFTE
jgi:hypothetical protein